MIDDNPLAQLHYGWSGTCTLNLNLAARRRTLHRLAIDPIDCCHFFLASMNDNKLSWKGIKFGKKTMCTVFISKEYKPTTESETDVRLRKQQRSLH